MIIDFSVTNKILTVKLLHMKKYFLILFVAILNICLIACNGSGDHGNQNSGNTQNTAAPPDPCEGIDKIDLCKDAGGIANIVIESTQAQKMMTNFVNIFGKEGGAPIRSFEPVYWLDRCVVKGIADYLRTQTGPGGKKLDGIRIYMACELTDNPAYGTDPYKRRTSVYIFPTINQAPVPPATSTHQTVQQKIPLTGTCSSSYLQDYTIADGQHRAFKSVYRKEGTSKLKDSLSESIWLDSCILFTLEKLIRLPNANIDGVNLNMAAYDPTIVPTIPVRGRFKDIQTTIMLVPTHTVGGVRQDYWDITDCLFKYAKALGWAPPGGLNHGELCPQVCN